MISSWQLVHIPSEISTIVTTLAIGLALAPWVGGVEVLGQNIPRLPRSLKKPIVMIATPCVLVALAAYYPLWDDPLGTATRCGFFRDAPGPNGEWQPFIPQSGKAERFWVGCLVHAEQSTRIRSVETAFAISDQFFVGLSNQQLYDEYQISENGQVWLSVPIETDSYAAALDVFRKPSVVTYESSDQGRSITGNLPTLGVNI